MSTDLKSSSKAYNLTRVATRVGPAITVGKGWNQQSATFSVADIEGMFANDDWHGVDSLNLLEETVERLKLDLARFAVTKGKGMEAY